LKSPELRSAWNILFNIGEITCPEVRQDISLRRWPKRKAKGEL